MEKKTFEEMMAKQYGMPVEVVCIGSGMHLTDEEICRSYGCIYEYLYERDRGHKIVNQLFPIYERVIEEHLEKARHFQRGILGKHNPIRALIDNDREYASAAITMCLYDEWVRGQVQDAGVVSLVNMVLYYALGK